jgi:hypothetical protein
MSRGVWGCRLVAVPVIWWSSLLMLQVVKQLFQLCLGKYYINIINYAVGSHRNCIGNVHRSIDWQRRKAEMLCETVRCLVDFESRSSLENITASSSPIVPKPAFFVHLKTTSSWSSTVTSMGHLNTDQVQWPLIFPGSMSSNRWAANLASICSASVWSGTRPKDPERGMCGIGTRGDSGLGYMG